MNDPGFDRRGFDALDIDENDFHEAFRLIHFPILNEQDPGISTNLFLFQSKVENYFDQILNFFILNSIL